MSYWQSAGLVGIALSILFAATWALGRRMGKWSIVDPIWSFSIGLNALLFVALYQGGYAPRQWIVLAGTTFYAVRLGSHLLSRTLAHAEDDPRYTQFAADWGEKANSRMFRFFQFQAFGSVLLSVSIFAALAASRPTLHALDFVGLGVMAMAGIGEAISDAQLSRFKRSAKDSSQVCKTGLWRYSRHPNYFFQWCFWLAPIPFAWSSDYRWLAWIAPALMLHFLLNVTGVPPTEKRALQTKGDAYRQYQKETSAFFPLPTKRTH